MNHCQVKAVFYLHGQTVKGKTAKGGAPLPSLTNKEDTETKGSTGLQCKLWDIYVAEERIFRLHLKGFSLQLFSEGLEQKAPSLIRFAWQ